MNIESHDFHRCKIDGEPETRKKKLELSVVHEKIP